MPRLSIWYIRASLLYLVLGFTLGGLLLFNKGIPLDPRIWILLPAHIESVLFGWTVQLVMGMAFWILPDFLRLLFGAMSVWLGGLSSSSIWELGLSGWLHFGLAHPGLL